jgi:hypothetical protein
LEDVHWGEELRNGKKPSGLLLPNFKVIFENLLRFFSKNP